MTIFLYLLSFALSMSGLCFTVTDQMLPAMVFTLAGVIVWYAAFIYRLVRDRPRNPTKESTSA